MSLEQALAENTAATLKLTALLTGMQNVEQQQQQQQQQAQAAEPEKKTTPKKSAPKKASEGKKETPKEIPYADVSSATVDLSGVKGKQAVVDILGEFGVATARDLKKEQYAAYIKRVNEEMVGSSEEDESAGSLV